MLQWYHDVHWNPTLVDTAQIAHNQRHQKIWNCLHKKLRSSKTKKVLFTENAANDGGTSSKIRVNYFEVLDPY